MSGASGLRSAKEHARVIQKIVTGYWTARDGVTSEMQDIKFRVGKYGKYYYTKNGKEKYVRAMPPWMHDMSAPPEIMLNYMDWIGVNKAVLLQNHYFGALNRCFGKYVEKWPDRLIGTAQIDESRAHEEGQIRRLKKAVKDLKLSALYYQTYRQEWLDPSGGYDAHDERLYPFWEEVSRLRVPVFFDTGNTRGIEQYLTELRKVEGVLQRFPDMVAIICHFGVLMTYARLDVQDRMSLSPSDAFSRTDSVLARYPNAHLEMGGLLFGNIEEEYPYPTYQKLVRVAYEQLGAEKLLWGTDMPPVLMFCTYRQCLDFVKEHCQFLSEEEKELVLGENLARIFHLKTG